MTAVEPLAISGYVLSGGRSSRMGQEKALLELAGRPLIAHAVTKLQQVCAEVSILSSNDNLAPFGPLVKDLHPDCGPMSGIEAALLHARHDWCLIVPVDLPFLPTGLLYGWARMALRWSSERGTRVALFTVDGVPQPTLLMIHRTVAPYLTLALDQGRYKLFPELRSAAEDLDRRSGIPAADPMPMMQFAWTADSSFPAGGADSVGLAELAVMPALYFSNLNTPEEFAEAIAHAGQRR